MSAVAGRLVGRRRGDPPPESPRDVVLVLRPDRTASKAALAAAAREPGTITVVLPLRIHGYALGLPNPGLMPNARERAAADEAISTTVRALRKRGRDVDGQIVVTRHAHRSVTDITRRRGAHTVVVDTVPTGRVRRFVEGDLAHQLARRLGSSATVTSV